MEPKLGSVLLVLFLIREALMLGGKVIQDRIEVVWFNDSYYDNVKMTFFNYNSTSDIKVLNATLTLKQDLPDVVMVHVQMYKLANNEYHLFPLNVTGDMCGFLAKDSPDTQRFRNHSNFSNCPMKKGTHYVSNMVLEQRKVPPYIPSGQFMAEATTSIYKNVNLLTTRSYARVQ